jgi:hypothetical protein
MTRKAAETMRNLPTERARYRLRDAVLCALLFGAIATACTGTAADTGPRLDDETANGAVLELSCLKHQPQAPGRRYTDDTLRRTDETLALLRYYTANGANHTATAKASPTSTGSGSTSTCAWARTRRTSPHCSTAKDEKTHGFRAFAAR